ncbi:MAG: hypothetical protein EO766_15855 [Hydrotalea sp. AMD]|nr:MAG: hypothetical protein EO766_15855 [Hydrotalea sp. AMD]
MCNTFKVMSLSFLKYWFAFLVSCSLICNISCKKISPPFADTTPKTFSDVFEQYWNKMNVNYVYWDVDTTNWDNIYKKYKPLFAKLDLNNVADIKKSVSYFKEMTSTLIDAHYYISFTQNSIIDSFAYPAYDRKKMSQTFHNPYSFYSVDTNYLDANFQLGIDYNFSFAGQPLAVLYGTINNSILYFSCNDFSLSKAYNSTTANKIQPVLNSFFNTLNNFPINIKGLIIDVRSNYGGDLSDLNFLAGRFIDKPLLFGYTQYKIGNGKLDYSAWIPSYVNPQANSKSLIVPIIILADNVSASLSEAVVMAIKAMSNSTFVGETTFGATGPIISDNNVYNDGSFTVPNFMNVQTSLAKFKYIDGKIYEGTGFSPDVFVPFNLSALQNNIDLQLEKAITLFK